jgi:DNA-directed RNA polymerase alpha subunit
MTKTTVNETLDWVVDRLCGLIRTKTELAIIAVKKGVYASAEDPTHAQTAVTLKTQLDCLWSVLSLYTTIPEYIRVKPITTPEMETTLLDAIRLDVARFSLRTRSVLENNNIATLGDLGRLSRKDLLTARNSGETVLDEILYVLCAPKTPPQVNALLTAAHVPIADVEISVRCRNELKKMGVETLADLSRMTKEELVASKGFGETSLAEIEELLNAHGLALGMEDDQLLGELVSRLGFSQRTSQLLDAAGISTLRELVSRDRRDLYDIVKCSHSAVDEIVTKLALIGLHLSTDISITELNLSVRARKVTTKMGILTVAELTNMRAADLLEYKNFGAATLFEVREQLANYGVALRGENPLTVLRKLAKPVERKQIVR